MNKKDIIRDERITIKVSKEEKDLFNAYAKEIGLMPTRLARGILLEKAESNFFKKKFQSGVLKAYRKYAEVTNNKEVLKRFEEHDKGIDN